MTLRSALAEGERLDDYQFSTKNNPACLKNDPQPFSAKSISTCSRNRYFWIFLVIVIGKRVTKMTYRGTL